MPRPGTPLKSSQHTPPGFRAELQLELQFDRSPFAVVAEDDPVCALILLQLMQVNGWRVLHVNDGKEAFEATCISGTLPDLVVMDMQMPNMNGDEATRLIRSFEKSRGLARLPILGFSGLAHTKAQLTMLDAGMDMVLPKPIDAKRLLEAIDSVVGQPAEPQPV
jgi:CheY-like chemotaxis protein